MEGFVAGIALAGDHAWAVSKQAPGLDEASIFDYKNLMGPCSLNLIFLIAHERIRFGGAVDRAAVDRAIDLAASLIFWGPGAKGPGPGTQLAPRDPGAPP